MPDWKRVYFKGNLHPESLFEDFDQSFSQKGIKFTFEKNEVTAEPFQYPTDQSQVEELMNKANKVLGIFVNALELQYQQSLSFELVKTVKERNGKDINLPLQEQLRLQDQPVRRIVRQTITGKAQIARSVMPEVSEAERMTALADQDPALCQALYYHSKALREEELDAKAGFLYKAVEVFKKKFGGWKEFGTELGLTTTELDEVKRVANEAQRDARHAPDNPDRIQPLTRQEIERMTRRAKDVILKYRDRITQSGQ